MATVLKVNRDWERIADLALRVARRRASCRGKASGVSMPEELKVPLHALSQVRSATMPWRAGLGRRAAIIAGDKAIDRQYRALRKEFKASLAAASEQLDAWLQLIEHCAATSNGSPTTPPGSPRPSSISRKGSSSVTRPPDDPLKRKGGRGSVVAGLTGCGSATRYGAGPAGGWRRDARRSSGGDTRPRALGTERAHRWRQTRGGRQAARPTGGAIRDRAVPVVEIEKRVSQFQDVVIANPPSAQQSRSPYPRSGPSYRPPCWPVGTSHTSATCARRGVPGAQASPPGFVLHSRS